MAKANYSQVPTVFLLVVNDANSMEAAELRERVAQSVRGWLLHEYVEGRPNCGPTYPARWQPADMRIVVARPSAPDGEVLLAPFNMPNLAWVTNNAAKDDIVLLGNATLEALGKRLVAMMQRHPEAARKAIGVIVAGPLRFIPIETGQGRRYRIEGAMASGEMAVTEGS